jgi:SAM-dependent methyltransferase
MIGTRRRRSGLAKPQIDDSDVTMSHGSDLAESNPANAPSARFFANIGIAASMRVLDVGCGNGDLSRFVAELVGPNGEVVAIDRDERALAQARAINISPRAAPINYRQIELSGELRDLGQFDAIVGRRVLMYLPDAAAALTRLATLTKPGAIIAFQEHVRAGLPCGLGKLTLHRQIYDWVWSTVAAEGGDVELALRLVDLMQAAGFTITQTRSEGILLQANEPSFVPTLAAAMLPRLVERGVASVEDMGLDTLAVRIEEECHAVGGTIVWDLAFLVSARLPHP